MKSFLVFAALLPFAMTTPVSNPDNTGLARCYCEPPICPLSLIAECKCKNAAAQSCYETYLAKGIQCPKPTPTPCGDLAARQTIKPAPIGPQCGGFPGTPCPEGLTCIDDPRDNCDPKKGDADCIGVCVGRIPCGGLKGGKCPGGYTCVDDKTDTCDPENGGRDCIGVCELAAITHDS
ncbi:hypothetical protein K469DRAFT_752315 [Zopfia rhizophila CBS 207.26]|uniref:Extracellular membrane protein CFEM domain-containing protein n=1 Tax=Zopfia rhizophila CBS 207.26 TaxID=1314779 RepID=A0A6A6DT56_9PEZI|nr:hypothetical protein K469DRAFT_752315 [Zopfia rhizophila CBS 207.26]